MRKRSAAVISALLGLNRNVSDGVDGEFAPRWLVNLADIRAGGLSPLGAWVLDSVDKSGGRVSGVDAFVGYDPSGVVSFRSLGSGGPRFNLSVLGALVGESGVTQFLGSVFGEGGAHIPGVGVYRSVDQFHVLDRDGNNVEPGSFPTSSVEFDTSIASRENYGVALGANQRSWWGSVEGADGLIYSIPYDASDVLVIDPVNLTASRKSFGLNLSGLGKWRGGVLASNGRIYCAPFNSDKVLVINTSGSSASASLQGFGLDLDGAGKWSGIADGGNGYLYCSPWLARDVLRIRLSNNSAARVTLGVNFATQDDILFGQSKTSRVTAAAGFSYWNGRYYFTDEEGRERSSADGESWVTRTLLPGAAAPLEYRYPVFAKGNWVLFLASGGAGLPGRPDTPVQTEIQVNTGGVGYRAASGFTDKFSSVVGVLVSPGGDIAIMVEYSDRDSGDPYGALWGSRDGGLTWRRWGSLPNARPTDNTIFFWLNDRFVVRSKFATVGGSYWRPSDDSAGTLSSAGSSSVQRQLGGVVGVGGKAFIVALLNNGRRVIASSSDGVSWSESYYLGVGLGTDDNTVTSMSEWGGTIFAMTRGGDALFSHDGGASWQRVDLGTVTFPGQPAASGVIGGNGIVYYIPKSNVNDRWVWSSREARKWSGIARGSNGRLFCTPFDSGDVLVINPSGQSASRSRLGLSANVLKGAAKWMGDGVVAGNGGIYCAPYDSSRVFHVVPSGSSGTASLDDYAGVSLGGSGKWAGGVIDDDERIFFTPFDASDFLVVDTAGGGGTRVSGGVNMAGNGSWVGGVFDGDETIFMSPHNADQILVVGKPTTIEPGVYEVLSLSSVITSAGRLVVDWRRGEFELKDGEFASIHASFPVPSNQPAWLDNFEIEVFVRFFRPGVLTRAGGFTRVAIMNSGASGVAIGRPGVGEQIGLSGAVAVAGFREGRNVASVALHNARVWFRGSSDEGDYRAVENDIDVRAMGSSKVVSFSNQGYVNLVEGNAFVRLNASTQSEGVTGLLPAPEGLYAFCDNETFVIGGDAALGDLGVAVHMFPDMVGLTRGARPAIVGGVPFTLWKGRVRIMQGSRSLDVSEAVWLRGDGFVDVVSDPVSRSLLLLSESGRVFRLGVDNGFWSELPVPSSVSSVEFHGDLLIPSPHGVLVFDEGGSPGARAAVFDYVSPDEVLVGGVECPQLGFSGFDGGDALRRDNYLSVSLRTESIGWGGDAPVLYWSVNAAGDTSVVEREPARSVVGRLHRDEWVFRFPAGLRGRKLNFLIDLLGMPFDAVIEPQVLIEFVPGLSAADRGDDA